MLGVYTQLMFHGLEHYAKITIVLQHQHGMLMMSDRLAMINILNHAATGGSDPVAEVGI